MYFLRRNYEFSDYFSKLSHFLFRAVATHYVSEIFTSHIRFYIVQVSLLFLCYINCITSSNPLPTPFPSLPPPPPPQLTSPLFTPPPHIISLIPPPPLFTELGMGKKWGGGGGEGGAKSLGEEVKMENGGKKFLFTLSNLPPLPRSIVNNLGGEK